MTIKQAKNILEEKGLKINSKNKKENSEDVEKGKVIGTNPKIGKSIKKSNKVTLIISKGSKKIVIEDYKGKNYEEIKKKLEKSDITVLSVTKEVSKSEDVKENEILSQDIKPGEKLGKGDTITFTIPNIYTAYPNFTDGTYTVADIEKFATDYGLTLDTTYVEDASSQNGAIIYQNQTAGSKVSKGANLRIKVVKNTEKAKEESKTEETKKEETTPKEENEKKENE